MGGIVILSSFSFLLFPHPTFVILPHAFTYSK